MLWSQSSEGASYQRVGSGRHSWVRVQHYWHKKVSSRVYYLKEPNRDWVWNLVNTLLHDEFQEFLSNKMTRWEDDLIKQQNLQVRAIPEIVDILKKSKAVSTSKGKSHFLLRPVIKRKSKNLIKLENQKAGEDAKYANESEKNSKKLKQKSINLNR